MKLFTFLLALLLVGCSTSSNFKSTYTPPPAPPKSQTEIKEEQKITDQILKDYNQAQQKRSSSLITNRLNNIKKIAGEPWNTNSSSGLLCS